MAFVLNLFCEKNQIFQNERKSLVLTLSQSQKYNPNLA